MTKTIAIFPSVRGLVPFLDVLQDLCCRTEKTACSSKHKQGLGRLQQTGNHVQSDTIILSDERSLHEIQTNPPKRSGSTHGWRLCSTLLTSPTLRCPGDVPGDGPRTSEVATIVAKGRLAAQPKQGAEPNWVSRGAETGRQSETPPTTLVFNWEEVQSTSWTNLELRSQGKQADFGSAGQTEG